MKNLIKLRNLFIVLLCITLFSCSDDSDNNDDPIDPSNSSYVEFNISGPTINNDFEYIDAGNDDDFNTISYFYAASEEIEYNEDVIQLFIGESYTASHFLFVGPAELGTQNITYQDNDQGYGISLVLSSLTDGFNTKNITISITELETNGYFVTQCKGTFSGTFYRNNLDESDVHEISGEFEING